VNNSRNKYVPASAVTMPIMKPIKNSVVFIVVSAVYICKGI